MKRLAVVAALAAIAVTAWYLMRRHAPAEAHTDSAPVAPPVAGPKPKPVDHATKLTPAQRASMAQSIADAQKARDTHDPFNSTSSGGAATHAPTPPRLPENLPSDEPAISKTELRAAMREVIPMLTECYSASSADLPTNLEITAKLDLTGDPDIGTIIDAHQLFDKDNKPLPAKFDDCLRSTFQTLALPPLSEGDKIEVHYPFAFSRD
jgi:hypothetical protein